MNLHTVIPSFFLVSRLLFLFLLLLPSMALISPTWSGPLSGVGLDHAIRELIEPHDRARARRRGPRRGSGKQI